MDTTISPAQQEILNLVNSGKSPEQISKKLDKDLGIVNAQITRLRTKGVLPMPNSKKASEVFQQRPASTGPTSNEAVAREIDKAGPAKYEIPEEAKRVAEKHGEALDIHPMVLLGTTIQFVKLCGGRLHAHQVIEDVYGALRVMVVDSGNDDVEHKTLPFGVAERIASLEAELAKLRSSLQQ